MKAVVERVVSGWRGGGGGWRGGEGGWWLAWWRRSLVVGMVEKVVGMMEKVVGGWHCGWSKITIVKEKWRPQRSQPG